MQFNINDKVKVKLTQLGRDILRANHRRVFRNNPELLDYTEPPVDAGGWTEFQLWVLMSEFGQHMTWGGRLPFETTVDITFADQGQP